MTYDRFLLDRARAFAPDTEVPARLGPRITLHHVAIATELALKAWLAHKNATDEWLADHIGHDLARAWWLADALGLEADETAREIVDQLDPHFRKGGFQHLRDFWTPGFEERAPALLDTLIACVAARL
jgi:hypothetical protein